MSSRLMLALIAAGFGRCRIWSVRTQSDIHECFLCFVIVSTVSCYFLEGRVMCDIHRTSDGTREGAFYVFHSPVYSLVCYMYEVISCLNFVFFYID